MSGVLPNPVYLLSDNTNKLNNHDMKTHKANRNDWREKVLKTLVIEYTIVNNKIVVKGSIGEYKTLVNLLVSERQKLGILPN